MVINRGGDSDGNGDDDGGDDDDDVDDDDDGHGGDGDDDGGDGDGDDGGGDDDGDGLCIHEDLCISAAAMSFTCEFKRHKYGRTASSMVPRVCLGLAELSRVPFAENR